MRMPDGIERVVRAPDEGLQAKRIRRGSSLEEGHANRMRPGLERHLELRPGLDVVASFGHVLQVRPEVVISSDWRQVDADAVYRVLELVLVLEAAHNTQIGTKQLDRERVLPIERQSRLSED